jgi:plasmid maintenance system antidote protein VapI
MALNKYSGLVARAKRSVAYWTRVAMRDFTEDLIGRMATRGMNNAALAAAAKVSPAYVTKVLRGSENFTLETMTKLAMAVGGKVHVHIADQSARTIWADRYGLAQSASATVNIFDSGTRPTQIPNVGSTTAREWRASL